MEGIWRSQNIPLKVGERSLAGARCTPANGCFLNTKGGFLCRLSLRAFNSRLERMINSYRFAALIGVSCIATLCDCKPALYPERRLERSKAIERLEGSEQSSRFTAPFRPAVSRRDQGRMSFSATITRL